jgi:acyl-CoA reductase-like NAD-dependent aldehyde dehydrogenase
MSEEKRVEADHSADPGLTGPASSNLQQVNAQLRDLITNLRSDQARHAEVRSMTPAPGVLAAVNPAPGSVPAAPATASTLERYAEAQLAQARAAVERSALERDRLARRVGTLEEENRRLAAELVAAQREILALSGR